MIPRFFRFPGSTRFQYFKELFVYLTTFCSVVELLYNFAHGKTYVIQHMQHGTAYICTLFFLCHVAQSSTT